MKVSFITLNFVIKNVIDITLLLSKKWHILNGHFYGNGDKHDTALLVLKRQTLREIAEDLQ